MLRVHAKGMILEVLCVNLQIFVENIIFPNEFNLKIKSQLLAKQKYDMNENQQQQKRAI